MHTTALPACPARPTSVLSTAGVERGTGSTCRNAWRRIPAGVAGAALLFTLSSAVQAGGPAVSLGFGFGGPIGVGVGVDSFPGHGGFHPGVSAASLAVQVGGRGRGGYRGGHRHGHGGGHRHGYRQGYRSSWGSGWWIAPSIVVPLAVYAHPDHHAHRGNADASGYGAVPEPVLPAQPSRPDPVIYPRDGQSAERTEDDRQQCNRWATTQPAALADADVFHRAVEACMDGRGYSMR